MHCGGTMSPPWLCVCQAATVRYGCKVSIIHCSLYKAWLVPSQGTVHCQEPPCSPFSWARSHGQYKCADKDTRHAYFSSVSYSFSGANNHLHPSAELPYLDLVILSAYLNLVQSIDHNPPASSLPGKTWAFSNYTIKKDQMSMFHL